MDLLPRILLGLIIIVGVLLAGLHMRADNERRQEEKSLYRLPKNITITSSSFPPEGDLPVNSSCQGIGSSPALSWAIRQPDVKSYVIIATDYSVPTPRFSMANITHWVVYNLPGTVHSIPEGVTTDQMQMLGGKIGRNSLGDFRFMAACPPVGRHAYVFRIYALNQSLTIDGIPDRQTILRAMSGHILSYGDITGYFQQNF